jgi:hypothetical protein
MPWLTIGIIVVLVLLVFLGLFFRSSGAIFIDDEEKKDIEHENPEEVKEDLKQIEKEDADELKAEEDQFYSHG